MYNHQPPGYDCPFCRIVRDAKNHRADVRYASDVICQTDSVTAFLNLVRWEKIPLDVIAIPNEHFENIYDLPLDYAPALHELIRSAALALKAVYHCDGVTIRQHNEPAGGQDVWHYHVHVTPRFSGDNLYRSAHIAFPEPERLEQAAILREYLQKHL